MFADHGFHRDVAIKILRNQNPDAEVLGRFRDEARLLGQIRHPNIPGVGPPIQLKDHWAVVMDLVEGQDCLRLQSQAKRLPARVVMDIALEVSRTLDYLQTYRSEPDDPPLELVHRDIKPSNIIISPQGTVSLLDFGIAKAIFSNRETFTYDTVGGTIGFIPPERVNGWDGPEGDIYSLGVVLHALVAGRRPPQFTVPGETIELPDDLERTQDITKVVTLAGQMRQLDPSHRPTAAQVARRAEELAAQMEGPSLREWAPDHVKPQASDPDTLVGTSIIENYSTQPVQLTLAPPRRTWIPVALVLGLLVLLVGITWSLATSPEPEVSKTPTIAEAQPSVEPIQQMDVAPLPVPVTTMAVKRPPTQEKAKAPVSFKKAPTPAPPATATITLDPPLEGWTVGPKGKSPLGKTQPGTNRVYVVFDGTAIHAATIEVQAGEPLRLRCNEKFQRCVL